MPRGGLRTGPPRLAACGHSVPFHPGMQRRACEGCAVNPALFCAECGSPLAGRRRDAKFCTETCGQMFRGQIRRESLAERVCALAGCSVRFVPRRAIERCCSERHGKALWNREARAAAAAQSKGSA